MDCKMVEKIRVLLPVCMILCLTACGDRKSESSGKLTTSGNMATTASVSGGSFGVLDYSFNDFEPVRYEDVVWTAMNEKMPGKEYDGFSDYLPALTGEVPVHWQAAEEDEEDAYQDEADAFRGSDKTVRQVFDLLEGKIRSVSLWDMTEDGTKELVIEGISSYPHMIIHKEGNEYFGDVFARRQFQSPQKSGYFWWGKGSGHWYHLSFRDKKFVMTAEAGIEAKTKENGADIKEIYYIHDRKTDRNTYKKWEKENLTGEIKWYEVPERKA